MHEVSIARDLLSQVEQNLDRDNARVLRVEIAVGSATGIISESLQFAFNAVARGTKAQGAELSIVTVRARSRCTSCGILFDFEGMIGACPTCGRLGGELVSGNEMILRSIEVADV